MSIALHHLTDQKIVFYPLKGVNFLVASSVPIDEHINPNHIAGKILPLMASK